MRLRACQRLSRGSRAILHLFPWSQVSTVFRNNDLSGSITWELHLCFKAAFPKHQPSGQNVHKYTFESKEKVKISPTDTQRRKQQPQWHWTPAHHQNMRNVWNRPPVTLPLLPDGCGCWGTSVSASYTNIMKMPLSIIPSPGGAQVLVAPSDHPAQQKGSPALPRQPRIFWPGWPCRRKLSEATPEFACALGDLANGVPSSLQLSKLLVKQ